VFAGAELYWAGVFPGVAVFLKGGGFKSVRRGEEQWGDRKLVQADHLFARIEVVRSLVLFDDQKSCNSRNFFL
jgi:hypothetical protein